MIYVIDIDGVISKKKSWSYQDSYKRQKEMLLRIKPNYDVIRKINYLWRNGHTIILHTSRIWKDYDATVQWLENVGVLYSQLIMAKPLGDFYIDDHNMSVEELLDEN